ncbi:MAG: gliding motility-associated C-terminal domain-containing protein [Flavobacteriales bacterium]
MSALFALLGPIPCAAQVFNMTDGAVWNSCTGNFYDSGGAAGNYGNNETMAATLCPAGGSGSGPATSLVFNVWNVSPAALADQLVIHDGATLAGTVLGTGSGLASIQGQTFTSTDPTGCLTFEWTSDASVDQPGWAASILTGPDAGTNGAVTLCRTRASVDLATYLGGTPDAGGTWTAPGGSSHGSTFNPASDVAGVYTYTVAGTGSCPSASATVTVTVNDPPSAGTNGTLSVCSNGTAENLFTRLGGVPDVNGAWTFAGSPVSNLFTPGTSTPGTYTYTVNGTPPCTNASATVTVTQVAAPDAGTSRSITVCSNEASFSMHSRLGGTPQAGGTWTGGRSDTFDPATGTGGTYTYTVPGTAPCADATASLTITVRTAPNAGTNGALTVCSTDADLDLAASLGGTPDVGGTWTAPGGAAHSSQFQPGVDPNGIYTYTVAGQAPCAAATTTVTMTVRTAPNAGTSSAVVKCSNAPSFSLFSLLGGTPQGGGQWKDPSMVDHSATFVPGTDAPGLYTYIVPGTAPCANAQSTVNVTIVPAPNAGTNGTNTVCSTAPAFSLFSRLGGTPNTGGTWTAPGGAVLPSGTFTPGTSTPGVYTYTVTGTAPCANAQSTVTVIVVQAADAGTNGSVTLCSNSPSEALFGHLGGTPDPSGTWTKPNGSSFNGTYNPADPTHPAGNYTYTVVGTSPCPNASAVVQVIENKAPNAGNNTSSATCSTNAPFQLFGLITGSPDAGGTWRNAGGQTVSGTFTPGTSPAGAYRYIVPGLTPCANDTATVTISVNTAPNAGTNGSTSICSDASSFSLFGLLGGTPDTGGSWRDPDNQSVNGTYVPGTSRGGAYLYTVIGTPPCANDISVVTVNEVRKPVAGTNGTLQVCSTDGPVDLFTRLGGTPDVGGTWTAPGGGTSSGVFIPGANPAGIYTYTVPGTSPCPNATATVTVTVNQAPNAGTDGHLTVCGDQTSVDLMTGLGGTPDANGTWTDNGNTGHMSGQFFSPLGMPPGQYGFTYTVAGNGQCGDADATVTVTIVSQLEAGSDGSISVCRSNTQVDLFTGLGGSPQQGGVWVDLDHTGAVGGHTFNASAVAPGTYHFRYELTGTLSCASDQAQATVTVVRAPNAGVDGPAVFCSDGPATALIGYLGGNPDAGGIWLRPNNVSFSGTYNPVLDSPGVYKYRVTGTPPCPADTGFVTVAEVTAPNAGQPAAITICANDAPFNMTARLGGSPSSTGTWTSPNGQNHGAVFTPGLDAGGVYIYTVTGTFPCTNAIATLTITVNTPPFAGNDVSMTVCSNAAPFLLFGVLTGGPQNGGSWRDPLMIPFPSGIYVPGTSRTGTYTYRVSGQSPCSSAQATVTVFESPAADAGISASIVLCSNGGAVNLFDALNGHPAPTGTWRSPGGGNFSGIFVPGTNTPGNYKYIVPGVAPCVNDTATVTVVVNAPPDAGTSRNVIKCSSDPAFALVSMLGGSPALNGTWRDPDGHPHNGIFTPGMSQPGAYTYTVAGTSPCAPATSTVTVTVNPAPNAGTNGRITLCSTSGAVNLFNSLGGTPQPGGTWTGPGNVPSNGTFLPSVNTPGGYTYTVTGLSPCTNASATVTVVVNQAPHAGSNGLRTVCNNEFPFPLLNVLSGNPGLNGQWTGPEGQMSGIYVPGVSPPGTYTYTVIGQTPCASSSAQATIIENVAPNAGGDGVVSVCSNQPSFPLLDRLQGSPNATGSWLTPAGQPFSGTFIPSSSPGGVYTYVVPGIAPCVNDTSHVTVVLNTAPNAGISTAPLVCRSRPPFALLDLLGGTPATNGTWLGPNSQPHGPVFDPATDVPGMYVYTVTGASPCNNATATAQITLVDAADAGDDGVLSACVSDAGVTLFPGLRGTPQAGGIWTTTDAQGHLSNGVFNATGVAPGTYHFTYTVAGTDPCPNDQTVVTVTVANALDAGADASAEVCNSTTAVALFNLLGGTPQPGGTWTDLNGSGGLTNGVLNAQRTGVGTFRFRYVLAGSTNCPGDTAVLTLTVLAGPRAGDDGFAALCSNQSPLNLFSLLGGTHDNNGHWVTNEGVPHDATFDPATGASDTLFYIVPAVGSCGADTAVVRINVSRAPNAGTGGNLAFCSNGAAQPLSNGLGGTPATDGTWTGPGNVSHSAIYNPAIDVPGQYTYTVVGSGVCQNATAIVVVSKQQAPFAGADNTYTACTSQAPFGMFGRLAGSPQSGGSWFAPGPVAHGPTFDPAVDVAGAYHYVVRGIAPCVSDTAVLTIALVRAPQAGRDSTFSVCVSVGTVDLFPALGPQADANGTWTDNGATGALTGSTFDVTAVDPGTYTFTYRVPGSGPCLAANALITVTVAAGADPGQGETLTICGGDRAYDLFNALTGTPDPGGTWSETVGTGALNGNLLDATLLMPGGTYVFRYAVTDPSCGEAFTLVELSVSPYADPGADSTVVVCMGAPAFALFGALSGTPDAGGTWTGPNGLPTDATFTPGTDAPGIYTYLLNGVAPCGDTTAQVTVQVNQPADAGQAGNVTLCNTGTLDLMTVLQGTPQAGGTWMDLDGSGALTGGTLDMSALQPDGFRFRYTVTVPGCDQASAIATVNVIDGVSVSGLERSCNEKDRTYTVRFTITGGDPATYAVTGLAGTISATAPYVFTSVPVITSRPFSLVVDDGAHCTPRTVEGVSPCAFEDEVFVPGSFTPNGDGTNDRFIIPGIEGFPNNTVRIFNRWGSEVYSAAGYDNRTVVWDGTCTTALMAGELPTGTYYYVVELGSGIDAIKGYVYLNR